MRLAVEGVSWMVDGATILSDVSTSLAEGQVTGLLGPNGSGKTTLLSLAAGLRRPTSGTVVLDDHDVAGMSARRRARLLALVEQQSATILDLRVRDVVELGRTPHRGRWPTAAEGAEVVREALARAEVDHLADRSWATLSGGERQRIQLARALAQEPSVLLLDEPTNHLDLGHQIAFLSLVRSLGVTTMAVLHDLDLAAAFCDRLVVLQGGRLVADGPTAEVLMPELVREVYGVRVTVEPHPASGRLHVTWHDERAVR